MCDTVSGVTKLILKRFTDDSTEYVWISLPISNAVAYCKKPNFGQKQRWWWLSESIRIDYTLYSI